MDTFLPHYFSEHSPSIFELIVNRRHSQISRRVTLIRVVEVAIGHRWSCIFSILISLIHLGKMKKMSILAISGVRSMRYLGLACNSMNLPTSRRATSKSGWPEKWHREKMKELLISKQQRKCYSKSNPQQSRLQATPRVLQPETDPGRSFHSSRNSLWPAI